MNNIIDCMEAKNKCLIGMVHCLPLPGTMNYGGSMQQVIDKAVKDASVLEKAGYNAIMLEPQLDLPSGINRNSLHVAAMAAVASRVRETTRLPLGISFSSQDCEMVFAIAIATGASFVRLPVFVDTVIFPAGVAYPCAVRAFEVRQMYGAQDIAILADIQVKHSRMMYPDIPIEESAMMAKRQGADAIIVTGATTGEETPMETIERVRKVSSLPLLVGSGVDPENIREQLRFADGLIIGSSIKQNGELEREIDYGLAKAVVDAK